jgi:6-phosphogluconolactonase (cycloisomerase 2 family)
MKFSKLGQLFLVSTLGLLVATLLTACQIVTIDFIYVASSAGSGTASNGQIDIFAVDSQSGALRAGPKTVSSGGDLPVAMAVSANYANIYVANQADSSLVHFTLALDGTPTQKDVVTLAAKPVSIAVNAAGTYLYAASGPGGGTLTAYSIGTDGAIGSVVFETALSLPTNPNDVIVPTAVTVLANNSAVYVTAYDQAAYNPGCPTCVTSSAHPGWVFGYTVGSGGSHQPLRLCHRLRLEPNDRVLGSVGELPQFPDQRALQDWQRAFRNRDRSARQIHLRCQLAGQFGLGLHD